MHPTTIGLDIAKLVFQVHGVDASGATVIRQRLRRAEVLTFFETLAPALIGMEACPTSHHWARELRALGHDVRLMPPAYVKPYVKRQKNDAADAEAICEAVSRPSMRFVPIKSIDQQSALMLHRARDLLIRQRTMLKNALRGHLAEFGLTAPQGTSGSATLAAIVEDEDLALLHPLARETLLLFVDQLRELQAKIATLDARILAWHRSSEISRRLETIPGIGPVIASALAATIPNANAFSSGRQLAAWIGLVPRQNSSGGKERLGRITKQGEPYLRRLLVIGAAAVLRFSRDRTSALGAWVGALRTRRPAMVATVGLANKLARIAWAVMARGVPFQPRLVAPA
jgi:transposase